METEKRLSETKRRVIALMSKHYTSVFWVDMATLRYETVKTSDSVRRMVKDCQTADVAFGLYVKHVVAKAFQKEAAEFGDFTTLRERLAESHEVTVEYKTTSADRSWCKGACLPFDMKNGEILSVLFIFEDIDEDKKKDEQLKQQMHYLNGLLSGYDTIMIYNLKTDICTHTYFAPEIPERVHIKVGEQLSAFFRVILNRYCHPDHQEMMTCYADNSYIARLLRHSKRHTKRFLIVSVHGGYHWVEMSLTKFADENEEPEFVAMTFTDVDTDEKEKRENQAALEDVKSIIRSSEMGIWHIKLVQGQKPSMTVDEKMRELLGLSPDDVLTDEEMYDAWFGRVHPDALESVNASVMRMITQGVRDENTYLWNHPTKGETYVRCGGTAVPILGGHLLSGYHYDVTKHVLAEMRQKQIVHDALEANRAKTVYLHNMIHEIRTPLNAIMGFSQLLAMPDGTWTENDKKDHERHISDAYNMLSMLIEDVLDVADSEHGNYVVNISDMNVNDVCRNSLMASKFRKPGEVNMFFTSEVDDNFTIQSDGRRITQVLVNFLNNACKHTKAGSIHLHCSTTERLDKLTFSVADTGEGVPPEMASEIFKRFKKHNANVQGSGLGLNICTVVAEKLNGEVYLDTNYTNGARFVFAIPLTNKNGE